MDTLLLIDGNNLAYRCRYTFQLSNRGQDISVVYGFLKVTESLIKKHKPVSVMVAWDGRVPKFRRILVPEYKANRHADEDPLLREDFNRQIRELHHYALPKMGILTVKQDYTEADDLLYHASVLSMHEENIIVTGDKDLLQALSSRTKVLSPTKDILYDIPKFEEIYGFPHHKFVWWKAIQGDGSDNIPGTPGIGEATASKYMKQYDSINKIFSEIESGTLVTKTALELQKFGISRILNNYDVIDLSIDRCGARRALLKEVKFYKEADRTSIKKYFLRNAFVSLLDTFPLLLSELRLPKFSTDYRYPVPAIERTPIENI